MAFRSVISSRIPMVIVVGATGTGKTKLGVELAQKFATEIISADSMQIYKGLDLVTAKASVAEREMARHHLLDILEPHQMFTVVDFRNRALKIIDNLIEQGKMPIIVGGTNYYIESVVYNILVEDMHDDQALLWEKSRNKRDLNEKEKETGAAKKVALDTDARAKAETTNQNAECTKTESERNNTFEEEMTEDKNSLSENRRIQSQNVDINDEQVYLLEECRQTRDLTDEEKQKNAANKVTLETDVKTDGESTSANTECTKTESKRDDQLETEEKNLLSKENLIELMDNEKNFTNEEIHAKLKAVDPVMGGRLHPNNRRKVLRSIEVWLKTGRRHSEILAEQKLTEGQLRRPGSTIIFWLKCEQAVHDERLNSRVDKMLGEGLIEELLDFHARHNKHRIQDGNPPDYTKGVFQTLGFKEFHDYLMLSEEERAEEEGKKLLAESIDNMKRDTRRYARRQNKMIRGRFLEHPGREIPLIFELDTTNVEKWDENVRNKAIDIISSYINGISCVYEPLKSNLPQEKYDSDGNSYNYCEVCERIILGDSVYAIHLKSIRHMKVLKKKKQKQEQEIKVEQTPPE